MPGDPKLMPPSVSMSKADSSATNSELDTTASMRDERSTVVCGPSG